MTAILIATIGTRDLMFEISSGLWYNIGDDRMQDGDIIGEQAEVIADLSLGKINYRDLTKHLLDRQERYLDRIKPVIIGKLLTETAARIEKLYLIGTDQKIAVPQRGKDTIHGCELIKAWVEKNYEIATTIIPLGRNGTNPANFEAMFAWWRETWRTDIKPASDREIWLGLQGGVGQTSEAGRISGLSLYGDRIQFFEFHQNERNNQAGKPSDYTGPFYGTNYLWDRTQQQVLGLLDRFDYAGAEELLKPYFQTKKLGAVPNLLRAGVAWNRGEFDSFFRLANTTNILDGCKQQSQPWWWMAYEQAYLAVVRLKQNNTAEAMLHSFRAVEGCLYEWTISTFPNDIDVILHRFPNVRDSILQLYPSLSDTYHQACGRYPCAQWRGSLRRELLEVALPTARCSVFQAFWDSQDIRNQLSHQLGGLSEDEVLQAWGENIRDRSQWEQRILGCLNILTRQSFKSLDRASLFAKVHDRVRQSIEQA